MSKPAIIIEENKTAQQAGELMKKSRMGCLIVTKNNNPVGILTDSDIIKKIVAKDLQPSKIKIKNIMSSPLVTISPNEKILEASRKMKKSNIKRLPVLDNGKIVGIISATDIARSSPEMLDILEYRMRMREEPFEIKEEFTSGICDSCGNYNPSLKNVNGKWLCEACMEETEE